MSMLVVEETLVGITSLLNWAGLLPGHFFSQNKSAKRVIWKLLG